jgi:hypothetical protein
VVPIERASEEAWAGVAALDRGESDENALDWRCGGRYRDGRGR